MAKILVLLPIWKREKITLICLDNLKKLQKSYDIDVLCIVSEQWAKVAAFDRGFKYVNAPNDCLGTKMNIGIREAVKYPFDYLMNLGDDDIITERLLKTYEPYMENETPILGISKVTFLDSVSKEAKNFDYKILIGAGRCIKRDILERELEKGDIYDKIQVGLDNNSMKKFEKYVAHIIDVGFGCLIDIKSDVNIWDYKILSGDEVTFEEAVKELETKQIDSIVDL